MSLALSFTHPVPRRLSPGTRRAPQEAAKGTTKRISLAGIAGVSGSPIDVDIPAGVDSGQTIQVGRGSHSCSELQGGPCSAGSRDCHSAAADARAP
jgi:hypothetical protein